MQIVIPPGQGLATAYLSLSHVEAKTLRAALDLLLTTGSSGWHAYINWGDYQTDVNLTLTTAEDPTGTNPRPDQTPSN